MNKKDFPLLVQNPDLVYLDSTATSLKPASVLKAIDEYYTQYGANVARGVYAIAERATAEYESAREKVARFINAVRSEEIVFTRGTTESINVVAHSIGRQILAEGDEVVVTMMEHHSNFVPWQQLALEKGASFKVWDVTDEGYLSSESQKSKVKSQNNHSKIKISIDHIISNKTKILALTYVSNVLGTINPVKAIAEAARKINPSIIVVVDAAQAAPHVQIDVQDLGCDFLAFSGHKMMGPTGIGVLWGKYEHLSRMTPYQYGGEMISEVSIEQTTYKEPPDKFEAGTPHIAGAIGLGAAVEYLTHIGMKKIRDHERELTEYLLNQLVQEFGDYLTLLGPVSSQDRGGVAAFTFGAVHPHDIAQILDEESVAIRVGSHCAMPLHKRFGLIASARASLHTYNDEEDVEKFITGLKRVKKLLGT